MKLFVVSTLPQGYPIVKYPLYTSIICLSSTFSILYHLYEESNTVITVFDFCMAGIWCIYDLHMIRPSAKRIYIYLTFILFCINLSIPYNASYPLYHTGWHILNAGKCLYTTRLVARGSKVVSV